MNLSNFKIGTRLYGGFSAVILMMAALLLVSYVNFEKLRDANRLNIHTYKVMAEVEALLESLLNIETGQRGFALTGAEPSLEPYKAGKEKFQKHYELAKSLTSDNSAQQDRLQKLSELQRQWLAEGIQPAIDLRREVNQGKDSIENLLAMIQAGKGKQGMDAMRVALGQIKEAEGSLLVQRESDARALRQMTAMTLAIGGVATALLAAVLAIWLTRNITIPLGNAVSLARSVAQGDLTVRIDSRSKDEVGQLTMALNDMNQNLVKIVGDVRTGTDTMATASSQIASGNMDLSSRTEQQASSLEETASSMEELTSTVKQNADNARQANQLAVSASGVAVKGGEVVAQVVTTMGSINESAKKIVDIIGVIDGIAFQTNILALNAAVEAARAGEQGRGFAVVASEVRNLAQRSAAAAKEIKGLIGDSVEKVDAGSKLVNEAGATMDEIVESVKRVTDIMAEIMAASEEQSSGIEQVNQAIGQMDQVTQQNAALVEEAAAAAESLQEQSANLAQVVSVFKVDGMQAARVAINASAPSQRAGHAATRQRPPVHKPAVASRPKAGTALTQTAAKSANTLVSRQTATTSAGDWEEF